MSSIKYIGITFGADPELFVSKDGEIIGAEKVIPKEGLVAHEDRGNVIIDGVQAEINVQPDTCRQGFSRNLSACFRELHAALEGSKTQANFSQTVVVSPDEMKTLDPASQQFGCSPSENAYGESKLSIKDASKYYARSAGGHLHLGFGYEESVKILQNHAHTVQILDILLGNTCVLIDRDPGNVARRKVYGKAGEYRTPQHGLEYRTLSNFWLRSYQLTSFVLALARFSVAVAGDEKVSQQILAAVNMDDIRRAINENDFDLAYQNFNAIKDIVKDIDANVNKSPYYGTVFPLEGHRVEQFEFFASKGLDHWFKEDPMTHWLREDRTHGWENFLGGIVAPQMTKEPQKEVVVEKTLAEAIA